MVTQVVSDRVDNPDGTFTINGVIYYDFNDKINPPKPQITYIINENAEPFMLKEISGSPSEIQSGWEFEIENKPYEITKILSSYPYIVSAGDHIIYFGDEINLDQTKIIPKTTMIDQEEYTIDSVLGAGNFGVVYLLVNKNDPKNKLVLKLPLNNSDDVNQHIEDQFYARLGFARGKDNQGNQVIAFMENCKTLYDEVFEREDGQKENLGERIKIAVNMLIAYKRFQDKFDDNDKPTHRDISPKNFLINQDTKECTLFDFGLSYHAEMVNNTIRDMDAYDKAELLIRGIKGGTRYMSPEMFDLKYSPDPRYDHYSLGVIVGEILGSMIDLYDETYNHKFFSPELRANLTPENAREAFNYGLRVNNAGDTIALLALNYDKDQEKSELDYEIIEIVQQMVKTLSGTSNRMTPEVAIKKLEELQIKQLLFEALKAADKLGQYRGIVDAVINFTYENLEINDTFIQNLINLLSLPLCDDINGQAKNELVTLLLQSKSTIYDEKLLGAVYKQIPYHSDDTKKIDMARDDMPFSVVCNDKNQVFIVLAKPLTSGEHFAQNLTTKEWVKMKFAWQKANNKESLKIIGENINILSGKDAQQQLAVFSEIVKEKKKCEEALLIKQPEITNANEIAKIIAELTAVLGQDKIRNNTDLNKKAWIVADYLNNPETLVRFSDAYDYVQTILKYGPNTERDIFRILKDFILASIENELCNNTIKIVSYQDQPVRMNENYAQYVGTKEWYLVENGKVTDKPAFKQVTKEPNFKQMIIHNGKVAHEIIDSFTHKEASKVLCVESYKSRESLINNDDDGSRSSRAPSPISAALPSIPGSPATNANTSEAPSPSSSPPTVYRK